MSEALAAENAVIDAQTVERAGAKKQGGWHDVPTGLRIGSFVFVGIVVLALVAPLIAPYDPTQTSVVDRLQGPNRHPDLGSLGHRYECAGRHRTKTTLGRRC